MELLPQIRSREDLLCLSPQEDKLLCEEIREFLIEHVADSGGHLASNLGIVEATVAIHKIFDTTKDKLVFDVGHQSYVHKILTGRMNDFFALRRYSGLCGFPSPKESVHDAFIAGHASNAVSVALGMARARTLAGEKHHVIALLGDGALTGGLAYEGLNDAGASGQPLVILLNDNGMSIAKNVGGISRHLTVLRLKPGYFTLKKDLRKLLSKIPGGKYIYRLTHRCKELLKRSLIQTSFFEEMGLNYLGPVDGHDVGKISYLLQLAKTMDGPALVHIITQKGKGYAPAEKHPQKYHGVGHFDPKAGLGDHISETSFSTVFGKTIVEMAEADSRICAVTAAMPQGTGLDEFSKRFPQRFYDVGIAEGHAVSMAAGAAAGGMVPVVALYSTFLQRAFDMMLHDVALMQNHVVFAVDRCGLVGEDGPTHHGVFDVGYLRQVPGMTVYAPATEGQLQQALHQAVYQCSGPVAVRYARGNCLKEELLEKYKMPRHAARATLISYGAILDQVITAARLLEERCICVDILQLMCIKPLDFEMIRERTQITGLAFVIEDAVSAGCVGTEIAAQIDCPCCCINLGDSFTTFGDMRSLYRHTGLDGESIAGKITEVLEHDP